MFSRQQWLTWLYREKRLLIELALISLVALITGLYFLEHFSSRVEAQQQRQLEALAQQTALRAAESLASDDRIGLNVIARQTRGLETVAAVRFLDTAGNIVSDSGTDKQAISVAVPVVLPDGEPAGSVALFAAAGEAGGGPLASGYILLVIALLLLRVALLLVERRVRSARGEDRWGDAERILPPDGPVPAVMAGDDRRVAPQAVCELRLCVVNFEHYHRCYTRGALQALLSDYQDLLQKAVQLHGGTIEQGIGEGGRVCFRGEAHSGVLFSALCAGLLFLRLVRLQRPRRKAHSAPALEFKALISARFLGTRGGALCLAGVPGRLYLPEDELVRAELDVKTLYRIEQAIVIDAATGPVRLQPIEQLAYRYQAMLRTQAEQVMEGGGQDPQRQGA